MQSEMKDEWLDNGNICRDALITAMNAIEAAQFALIDSDNRKACEAILAEAHDNIHRSIHKAWKIK